MSDRDRSKDKNGGKKKSGRGWALRVFVLAVVLSALLSFFSTTALEGTGYVVAALVLLSFVLSFACSYLPGVAALSDGTRTILLTVLISGAAAVLFPVPAQEEVSDNE